MKSTSLKQYVKFITDHQAELNANQYVTFIETILSRMPLAVIHTLKIVNKGETIIVGFKKPDGPCPFCDASEGI